MEYKITNSEIYDFIKEAGGLKRIIELYDIKDVLDCYHTSDIIEFYPTDEVLNELGSNNYHSLLESIPHDLILDYVDLSSVIEYYDADTILTYFNQSNDRKDFLNMIFHFITDKEASVLFDTLGHISIPDILEYFKKNHIDFLKNIDLYTIKDYIYMYEKYNEISTEDLPFFRTEFGCFISDDCTIADILSMYDVKAFIESDYISFLETFNININTIDSNASPIPLLKYYEYIGSILQSLNEGLSENYINDCYLYKDILINSLNNLDSEFSLTFNTFRTVLNNYIDFYSEIYSDVLLKFDKTELSLQNTILRESNFPKEKNSVAYDNEVTDIFIFEYLDDLFRSLDIEQTDIHSGYSPSTIQ